MSARRPMSAARRARLEQRAAPLAFGVVLAAGLLLAAAIEGGAL